MASHLTPYKWSQLSSVSSTSSTPGADNFFWDAPETPSRQSIRGDFDLSTPLTPPMAPNGFDQTCEPPIKSRSVSVVNHVPPTTNLSPDSDPFCENSRFAQTGPIADAVTPRELFHNCKNLLLAIVKNSNSEPRIQYSSTPLIEFCPTEKSSPDNAVLIKEESESANSKVIKRNLENGSVTASNPHSKGRYKGIQAIFEHIMPSDLHNKFRDDPELCVASYVTKPSVRCSDKTQRQSIHEYAVLDTVSRCIRKGHLVALPEELKRLAKFVLCSRHQNVALRQPKSRARIDTLQEFIINLSSASEKDALTFRAWTMALTNLTPPISTHCNAPKLSLTEVPLETNTTIASNSKTSRYLPEFLPYKSSCVSDVDIIRDLKELIAKPLSQADLKSGFIYIFWNQGSFGMVKIGRTNDLERRLKEWKRCKSTHFYHKASHNGELLKVPYVQRIEKLIHAELVNIRKTQACDTCRNTKVHKEWFQISEAKAVEVFQKWRTWILNEPYMKNDESEWVIKPEMLETIPELCTLKPEKILGAKTQSRTAKNRSKRPKTRRSFAMQALHSS